MPDVKKLLAYRENPLFDVKNAIQQYGDTGACVDFLKVLNSAQKMEKVGKFFLIRSLSHVLKGNVLH